VWRWKTRACSARRKLPSVVLVTVDTLRADHLGCYGYERARTEIFDEFAEKGILFEDAHAPAAITAPSHASILTGMTPAGHGVLWNGDSARKGRGVITLADALKAAGYQTAAFVSGYPLKSEAWGLSSGFGTYDDDFGRWPSLPQLGADVRALHLLSRVTGRVGPDLDRLERNAGETTDKVLRWIQTDAKPPFFLWVHYYDPHLPYAPPDHYVKVFDPHYAGPVDGRFYMLPVDTKESIVNNRADFRDMIARYDGEVAFVNDQFARLLGALASRGWRRNTLMVLTADHGETHGEQDRYFSRDLSQHCLHVPLIFSFPEGAIRQGRLKQQVRLIDIAPTVLEFVGLPRNPAAEGVSLMPAILGTGRLANRPVFALAMWPAGHIRSGVDSFALRDNGLKLIWNSADWFGEVRQPPREELYDTLTDPEETSNMIADAPPSTLAELRKRLVEWRSRITPSGRGLSERELQKLRTLGYLQ